MADELVLRAPVLDGEVVDVELNQLVEQYGLMGAIQIRMWRRFNDRMEREIFQPQMFVPGANRDLATIDLDDLKAGKTTTEGAS